MAEVIRDVRVRYKRFFGANDDAPSLEIRQAFLDPASPTSPYYGFVGNRPAVRKLIRIDTVALGRWHHRCSDLNVAVIGRPGCGKTDLVRRHCRANDLPTLEVHPKAIRTAHELFCAIRGCVEYLDESGPIRVPPAMNIFIDEVHALEPGLVQALLKATEPTDRMLVTEKGVQVNTRNIHWIIATTDRGRLFDAFDTRFTKVALAAYSLEETAAIVQTNHPDWPGEACLLAARYGPASPREAIQFAQEMHMERMVSPRSSWEKVAQVVASDNGIDEWGMSATRVSVLRAVASRPVAARRLASLVGVKEEELEAYVLPGLAGLVAVTGRGYALTPAGAEEAARRKITASFVL